MHKKIKTDNVKTDNGNITSNNNRLSLAGIFLTTAVLYGDCSIDIMRPGYHSVLSAQMVSNEGKRDSDLSHLEQILNKGVFERPKLDIKLLPEVGLENSKHEHRLTKAEEMQHWNQLIKDFPMLEKAKDVQLSDVYTGIFVRFEPNLDFANRLILEADSSINHMLNFLGSNEYIPKPVVKFSVPQKQDEVRFGGISDIVFYLVANARIKRIATYNFPAYNPNSGAWEVGEGISEFTLNMHLGGLSKMYVGRDKYIGQEKNYPIFFVTSGTPVSLAETPPIEVLHKILSKYTIQHLEYDLKHVTYGLTEDLRRAFINRWMKREELFVHALSILWLREYHEDNKDRNLGFSEDELNKRFRMYEKIDLYRQTNILSQHIAKIGIDNAIRLYVTKTDELFSVLKGEL